MKPQRNAKVLKVSSQDICQMIHFTEQVQKASLLLFDSAAADVIAQDGLTELGRADDGWALSF